MDREALMREWRAINWFFTFALGVVAAIGIFAGAGIWIDGGYPVIGAAVALAVSSVCLWLIRMLWRSIHAP